MTKKKVALIGTNGVPAHYGGIETLAEYLTRDLGEEYDLYCYCSKTPKEKPTLSRPSVKSSKYFTQVQPDYVLESRHPRGQVNNKEDVPES